MNTEKIKNMILEVVESIENQEYSLAMFSLGIIMGHLDSKEEKIWENNDD